MFLAKGTAEAVVGNAVPVVSAPLLPGAVIRLPALRAMLLPYATLDALLFLSTLRSCVAPGLLGIGALLPRPLPLLLASIYRLFLLCALCPVLATV